MEKKAAAMLEAYAIGASAALQEIGMDKMAADDLAIKLAEEPGVGARIGNIAMGPLAPMHQAALAPHGQSMDAMTRAGAAGTLGAAGGAIGGSLGGAGVGALTGLLSRGRISPATGAAYGGSIGSLAGLLGGGAAGSDYALRKSYDPGMSE